MSVDIGYDVHGRVEAPVLVLASSIGTLPGMWAPQLAAFAEHFRVVRVAHRGHLADREVPPGPYSMADLGGDVLALLDGLGVGRFSFCGLSLGGMVGMWLGSHAADRVERLALCCTSARLPPAQGWHERAAAVRADGMAAVTEGSLQRWFTPGFADEQPAVVQRCRDMLLSVPPEGYAGCCEAIAGMDLRADLAAVTAPTLVLSGGEDPTTTVEHTGPVAAAITGARHVVVPGVAHLATVQDPETTTPLLLDHLLDRA